MGFLDKFKKNDDSFKMDDTPISNLSGSASSSDATGGKPAMPSNNMTIPMSGGSSSDSSSFGSSSIPGTSSLSTGMDSHASESFPSYKGGDYNPTFNLNKDPNDFGGKPVGSDSDHSSELSQAKMSTIEAKVSLIEAKLNAIDAKLDVINQVLMEETSEETKKKLKLKDMMSSIKAADEKYN